MNQRDEIMDKYWLEFLKYREGDYSSWNNEYGAFWEWFYKYKMENNPPTNLEDYLLKK